MRATRLLGGIAACLTTILLASSPAGRMSLASVEAQQTTQAPKRALISLYRVAPGKHLEFLKWMAQRETIATEAGVGATQWYAHESGDSWDYIAIGPVVTEQQDQKIEALEKQRGMTSGFAASLEFRQFASSHTDTYVRGPMSVAEMVNMAGKR